MSGTVLNPQIYAQIIQTGSTGFVPLDPSGQAYAYQTCFGQMAMPSRDLMKLPQEMPYQNRAFHETATKPQMGSGGGDGIAQHVDVESTLREQTTRLPGGCNVYLFRDGGNFYPMPCDWQQPDYRPLHFSQFPRMLIKTQGYSHNRAPDMEHGGGFARLGPTAMGKGLPSGPYGNYNAYQPAPSGCINFGAVTKTV